MTTDDLTHPELATIVHDGRSVVVSVRIAFDGIEYIGRLWFADEDAPAIPDRGAVPGRSKDEVLALARRLTPDELRQRYRRALSEKRRYLGLRRVTDEILTRIRYLNQLAISTRSGLLEIDGAAQEIALTEKQLHELVGRLREYAGAED